MATNECTSIAAEVLKQCMRHRLMQHDQGFTRSHWTPPSGNHWLCIAPAAARATANKTKVQNVSTLPTSLMAIAVRQYYTARITRWRRPMAFIKATKRRHRASTRSNRHQSDMPTPISGVYFIVKLLKKSSSCLNSNRGVTHLTDENHLNNTSEYFVGVVNTSFN